MKNQLNVPKLRFPDFNDDWVSVQVGDVVDFQNGKPHENDIDEKGNYVVVNSKFISQNGDVRKYSNKCIMPLHKDDIVMVMSDVPNGKALAKCFLIDEDDKYTLNQRICVLKENGSFNPFLIYLINRNDYYLSFDSSVGQTNLKKEDVLACPIQIPSSIIEQTKITKFLTAVDEIILKSKKKKVLLEQYKKGIMQELFSQELRFKNEDGNDFADWDFVTLGEIAEKITKKNKTNDIINVFTNSAAFGIVNQRDFFDKDIANQDNLLNYYIVEKDDFVYNPRISNLAPVGPIGRNHLNTGVMSPLYAVFRINHGVLDFFEFYFSSSFWHEYMKSIANYGARADRMNITNELFYQMPLPFPCIQEQQKIASFLTSLDDKISQTALQIVKMQLWKKGLLQQMFV